MTRVEGARLLEWTDSPEPARREACAARIPGVEGVRALLSRWQSYSGRSVEYWVQLTPSVGVPAKWVRFYAEPETVGEIVGEYLEGLCRHFGLRVENLSYAELLGAACLAVGSATDTDEGAGAL